MIDFVFLLNLTSNVSVVLLVVKSRSMQKGRSAMDFPHFDNIRE